MEFSTDCDSVGTLTRCVDDFLDLRHPRCTSYMLGAGNCSRDAAELRVFTADYLRKVEYQHFAKETGCRRRCLSRRYELDTGSEFRADSVFDVGPAETRMFVTYRKQHRIRFADS